MPGERKPGEHDSPRPEKYGAREEPLPRNEIEAELDAALAGTFPASDPVALACPTLAGAPDHPGLRRTSDG